MSGIKNIWLSLVCLIAASICFSQSTSLNTEDIQSFNSAKALLQNIKDHNKFISSTSALDASTLPVGIKFGTKSSGAILAVDNSIVTGRGGLFGMVAELNLPMLKNPILFKGMDIAFNPGGIGFSGQSRLVLMAPIQENVTSKIKLVLPADGSTYIEWGCDGLKNIHLKGFFVFDKTLIVPDSSSGNMQAVQANFEVSFTDPANFMITADITPFTLAQNNEFSFKVAQLTADFSDKENPKTAVFPIIYQQQYRSDLNLWKGFYIKESTVSLPAYFSGKNGRTTLQANDLLIDEQGVSGRIAAKNVLSQKDNTLPWPISIDDIEIEIIQNKLTKGKLAGRMNVPFLNTDSLMYAAEMKENEQHQWDYRFFLALGENKVFRNPFGGEIILAKNSSFVLNKVNGELEGSASLNGIIRAELASLNSGDIKFEQLTISSKAPYLIGGKFDLGSTKAAKFANFSLSFENIGLNINHGKMGLMFDAKMALLNSADKGGGVTLGCMLKASVSEEQMQNGKGAYYTKHQFKTDGIEVNKIGVNVTLGAFSIDGVIGYIQNDDQEEFTGKLNMKMPVLSDKVTINANFGSTKDFRYFHFDVFAPTKGIPFLMGTQINGIIGGVSYRMSKPGNPSAKPDLSLFTIDGTANTATTQKNIAILSSGYIPDPQAGMHFMGGLLFSDKSKKVLNANLLLELAFNKNNGLKFIQFTGVAYLLTPAKKFNPNISTFNPTIKVEKIPDDEMIEGEQFYAKMQVNYDFINSVFHANLSAYLNIQGILKGIDNGRIGEAVIHFDPNDWYVYVGRPSKPIGLDIAGVAKSQSYFMVGSKIESMPPPPAEVTSILGDQNNDISSYLESYATGRGIAFGARINVGFDKEVRPFYAMIKVGAGADIMFRQYANVKCKGESGEIGWNGWYASGQAYAYLMARVGVKVGRKNFNIMDAGLAALLQAQLPNPSWFSGQFAGRFSVLGGLVKGNFKISFTIGNQCEIENQGSDLGDVHVIEDVKPDDKQSDVDVFAYPQVSFNTAVEKEIRMMNLDNQMETYRIKVAACKLNQGTQPIVGKVEWNSTNDVASINTPEVLPPLQSINFTVKVYWEKKMNGVWKPLLKGDGTPDTEEKSVTFTTGAAPSTIPASNVAYAYPVNFQYNFHPKEYSNGYVQLKRGQAYLFPASDEKNTYNYIASFLPANTKTSIDIPLKYDVAQKTVQFNIPEQLKASTIYQLSFIRTPQSNNANKSQTLKVESTQQIGGDGNTVTTTANKLSSTAVKKIDFTLYQYNYRTSVYSTFTDKWEAMQNSKDLIDIAQGNLWVIGKKVDVAETFDAVELNGIDAETPAILQRSASPNNRWLKSIQYPLLYEWYSSSGLNIGWRNTSDKGLVPLQAISLSNLGEANPYQLTADDVQNTNANSKSGSIQFGYFLSYYVFKDFIDLRNAAAYQYIYGKTISEGARRILQAKNYTDLIPGETYPIEVSYQLPGLHKITTTKTININF
jgi:hypothetical protein